MNASLRRRPSILRTAASGGIVISAGAIVGFWLAGIVPDGTLISVVKYATVLLGIVWAFSMIVYDRLSDLTDLAGIDYKQHRGLESAIHLRLQWFWYRATVLGIVGLTANLPLFLKDGGITPQSWTFAISAASLALAMFLLRRVWIELEDIRELRSEVKELERKEQQRATQARSLKDGVSGEWEADPQLGDLERDAGNMSQPKDSR